MRTINVPLEEAVAFLVDEVEVRPGFRELVGRFRPLVLSSGFHETIEPILAREGVAVELVANHVDPRPDGWRVLWNDAAPCPECGDLCKRRGLPSERPLVYAGDGYSDRCAALAADRVFARRELAAFLAGRGLEYEPFETFDDVSAALA
jgi:2-hydroxy-3-keto-5-methylthiopentenyl-1-phosphate phosphatase